MCRPSAARSADRSHPDPDRDFVTILVVGQGRPPRLAATSRHAALAEDIYAQDGWFWWSWAERLAPYSDTPAAAGKLATTLRVTPEPTRG